VEGLTDEATVGQLAGLLFEIDSQGRIKIESKEQARARGVSSPDRAEALMLAFGEPPPEYAYYSSGDRSRLESGRGDAANYDDDDMPGRGRRFRGRGAW
jgi:hypothetical protein